MKFTTPKIFHLAGTKVDQVGLQGYLEHIGAPYWTTDSINDGEVLIEVAGKVCYRSFSEELNANLRKVRRNANKGYLKNILNSKHGSVLEHVYDTYVFVGVSRVFTHEMVRHRISDFSQESLRFVRLTDLEGYFPSAFQADFLNKLGLEGEGLEEYLRDKMMSVFEYLEEVQLDLANKLELDDMKNFDAKKKITSSMRRLAPIGLATAIIVTSNARNWRHVISQRTSRHAEEEIRLGIGKVFNDLMQRNPNVYQDAKVEIVEGLPEVTFEHDKV